MRMNRQKNVCTPYVMRTVCPARFASLSFAVAPSGIGTLWTRSRAGAGAVGGSSVSVGVTLAAIVAAA